MIAQQYNSIHVKNNLLKQIKIKENQLKIAQESNMLHVAEALQNELLTLQCQLSEPQDVEVQALMSLLDD
jgi:predicted XRE-type DNA-binding protein